IDAVTKRQTETFAHPTQGNNLNAANAAVSNPTNAGSLPGVANIQEPRSYQTRPNVFRNIEGVLAGAATAADYQVWWGAAGAIDSVVDITNNVLVPFSSDIRHGYTWGFLTQAAATVGGNSNDARSDLTVSDFGCVSPLDSATFVAAAGGNGLACGALARTYNFVNTVAFGPIAFANNIANDKTAPIAAHPGFGMYLAGHIFLFEMAAAAPTAPTAGTVWTLRTYTGAISGGGGAVGTGGNQGVYSFTPSPSPLTAVGSSLKAAYSVTNSVVGATKGGLDAVHTVPDPYYVTNAFESSPSGHIIKFVNLPTQAIIRIYSTSGVLVRVLEHNSTQFGGMEQWDVRNRNNQVVASGVYFYHIEAPSGARRVGRMTIVNFAQ
ncbi:MAG: hypothetical protein JF590_05655, partial [Gemmatimonadetes bacterium]|nr:hypothetical protein [Gemmatimonadota bacterium]